MEIVKKGFQNLEVWKAAHKLVLSIYRIIKNYPSEEKYNLNSQILRAAVSIPTNIAEGTGRSSNKELIQYFIISRGSLEELKYLMILSHDLAYIGQEEYQNLAFNMEKTSKMLNALIRSLRAKTITNDQ